MKDIKVVCIETLGRNNLKVIFENNSFFRGEILVSNNGIQAEVWNDTQYQAIPSNWYVLSVTDVNELDINNIKSFKLINQ